MEFGILVLMRQRNRHKSSHHFCFQTQMGDFDQTAMLRQLKLWGRVIIPAVQRELANDTPSVLTR